MCIADAGVAGLRLQMDVTLVLLYLENRATFCFLKHFSRQGREAYRVIICCAAASAFRNAAACCLVIRTGAAGCAPAAAGAAAAAAMGAERSFLLLSLFLGCSAAAAGENGSSAAAAAAGPAAPRALRFRVDGALLPVPPAVASGPSSMLCGGEVSGESRFIGTGAAAVSLLTQAVLPGPRWGTGARGRAGIFRTAGPPALGRIGRCDAPHLISSSSSSLMYASGLKAIRRA